MDIVINRGCVILLYFFYGVSCPESSVCESCLVKLVPDVSYKRSERGIIVLKSSGE